MNAGEAFDAFRADVQDEGNPKLWKDAEVWRYLNDAYRMFVRLTGGIPDFTSQACELQIIAGEPVGVLHPSILRIMSATRRSDGGEIDIINSTDLGRQVGRDYGASTYLRMDNRTGQVRYGVIGMQRDTIRWISVPVVDDIADLVIRRLPLERIEDREHELGEIEEDHHIALLLWMKHLAYLKQDADATDKNKSMECRALFEGYCSIAKAEAERYKHKHRAVAYGGL